MYFLCEITNKTGQIDEDLSCFILLFLFQQAVSSIDDFGCAFKKEFAVADGAGYGNTVADSLKFSFGIKHDKVGRLACFDAVTTLMLFISFSLIDVGVATTIHFIYPVFVTLGCVMFYKEKLGMQKFFALLIATSGIACFFFGVDMSAGFGGGTFMGLFLAVASGVTYAFYIIYMDKSGLKNQPVFKITFYVALMSSIAMGIFGMGTGQLTLTTLTPEAWYISIVFALLCTVVALSLLQIGIKHVGASTAAILTTFEPITSIICGVLLLGETVTTIKIMACALILIGVVTLSLAKEKKPPEEVVTIPEG